MTNSVGRTSHRSKDALVEGMSRGDTEAIRDLCSAMTREVGRFARIIALERRRPDWIEDLARASLMRLWVRMSCNGRKAEPLRCCGRHSERCSYNAFQGYVF